MAKKPKTHYQNPNRRSNRFKGKQVSIKALPKERLRVYKEHIKKGASDGFALARALEVISK
jgi:hypothetical protein|tara:strand:+ start:265 stop:447 length:183 start_codon:yes stop_codon:yes gene_type:complete